MPKNCKTGTPHKKNRACPLCDHRTRNMRGHLADVHGIQNMEEWYHVQFERYMSGTGGTIYDRPVDKAKSHG